MVFIILRQDAPNKEALALSDARVRVVSADVFVRVAVRVFGFVADYAGAPNTVGAASRMLLFRVASAFCLTSFSLNSSRAFLPPLIDLM